MQEHIYETFYLKQLSLHTPSHAHTHTHTQTITTHTISHTTTLQTKTTSYIYVIPQTTPLTSNQTDTHHTPFKAVIIDMFDPYS